MKIDNTNTIFFILNELRLSGQAKGLMAPKTKFYVSAFLIQLLPKKKFIAKIIPKLT